MMTKEEKKQKISNRIAYAVFILISLFVFSGFLVSLSNGLKLIGKPFPGFLLAEADIVVFHAWGRVGWTGSEAMQLYAKKIVAVDGEKITNSSVPIFRKVRSKPPGTTFTYDYTDGGDIRQIKVKSMRFGVGDYIQIFGLINFTGLCFFLSGVLIFLLRPNTVIGWGAFIYGTLGGGFYFTQLARTYPEMPSLFTKIFFNFYAETFVLMVGVSLFYLSVSILDIPRIFKGKALRYIIVFVPFLFGAFILNLKNLGIIQAPWQATFFSYLDRSTSLLALFAIFWSIKSRYFSKDLLVRQRARLLLLGFGVTCSIMVYGFLAIALGNPFGTSFAHIILGTIALPISIAYGALGSNLFETEEIVKKTLQYFMIFTIFGGLVGSFLWASSYALSFSPFYGTNTFRMLSIAVFLLISVLLKQRVQNLLDRIFFRKKVSYVEVFHEVKNRLVGMSDRLEVLKISREILMKNLLLGNLEILLKNEKTLTYQSADGQVLLQENDELIMLVNSEKQLISANSIRNEKKYKPVRNKCLAQFAKVESVFVLPILFRGEPIGIIGIGEKKSGDITFSANDVQMVRYVAIQMAVTLENAHFYRQLEVAKKELEKLNTILAYRVEERSKELLESNAQLELANKQILSATRHKAEFLANMTHDLRTPMNGVLGFSDMILDGLYGDVKGETREKIVKMRKNGWELLQLINNILDFSKIEANMMELAKENYSVMDLVDMSIGKVMTRADEKKIKLETDVPKDLPMLNIDPKKIAQVLESLVDNAVKFSNKGKITVRVRKINENMVFEVKDTGIGITADRIANIFEEFEEAENPAHQAFGGVGLGLALSKRLVELHDGSMEVESTIGKGSKFTFSLPVQ